MSKKRGGLLWLASDGTTACHHGTQPGVGCVRARAPHEEAASVWRRSAHARLGAEEVCLFDLPVINRRALSSREMQAGLQAGLQARIPGQVVSFREGHRMASVPGILDKEVATIGAGGDGIQI